MRVLSFGEILFDIIEGEHYLGGAPLNFAAHLAQLGDESYIYSRLGRDALGEEALRQIQSFGLRTEYVQQDSLYPTGTVPVVFRNGQPDYTILEKVAYDFIRLDEGKAFADTAFDVLYFGTLAQRHPQSRETLHQIIERKKFKEIFYDVNLRKNCYTLQLILQSLKRCSILKLNDEEVQALSRMFYGLELDVDAFCRKFSREHGIRLIIVTAGARGCYVFEQQSLQFVPGHPARVVDTIGAGDSFSAAFLHFYLKNGNALLAADKANRLGAFVASARGPLPAYTPDILDLLQPE
jgi:fructokinase